MFLEIWIFLSLIVGFLGRKTILGFWGTLIFSLFFSPLIVVIYVILSDKAKENFLKKNLN